MRYLLTLFLIVISGYFLQAQDKIIKLNREVIECKVTEVGLDVIKYKLVEYNLSDDLVISISIDEVAKIVFSNGKEMIFTSPLENPDLYVNDKKNAIKVNWISPIVGFLAVGYEKSIQPGRSMEYEVGFIGIGNQIENTSGVYLATGLKYFELPDFNSKRLKYSHILKGRYIKPQAFLAIYGYDSYNFYTNRTEDYSVVAGALIMNVGKQTVFANTFLLDFSLGVGYGFNIQNGSNGVNEYPRMYHYGFAVLSEEVPLAVAAKFKIGYLFR